MVLGADKKSWEEGLFFASYLLWLISAVLRLTMFRYFEWFDIFYAGMQVIAFLLVVVLFFLRKRNTLKDIIGIAVLFFCLILSLHSHNIYIIPTAIYIYFGAEIDFQKILKVTFIVQAIIMIFVIFSSQVGVIEDVIWDTDTRARHSLGYDYSAYPSHLLFFMSLMWFCIRKKIRAVEILVALALNYVLYYFTNTNADFLLAVLGILGIIVWQRDYTQRWVNAVRSFCVKFGFPILAVISILAQSYSDFYNPIYYQLNIILNNRLYLGYTALHEYGLSLFGVQVTWIGRGRLQANPASEYNYVDNAYLQMGITFGIIFLILLAVGFYLTGKYLIERKEYKLSWAILMSLAYGVLNAHLCMPAFNVFILLLGCCFKKTKETDSLSVIQRFRHAENLTNKE